MKTTISSLLVALAALPAGAMFTDQPNDQVPDSMKGKRITFFYKGSQCLAEVDPDKPMQEVKPAATLRFVNFNYGNTSNGKNGGTMTYTVTKLANGAQEVVIKDDKYSGSGYRIKGNPKGDSGVWHLYFEFDGKGSAWFMGTEDGKLTYYHDVAFVVTPVAESAAEPDNRSSRPSSTAKPGKAGVAPESMEDMVITLMPQSDQPIEKQEWVMMQMFFGKDYETEGRRHNHIIAFRQFGQESLRRGTWVNAFLGESEECLFPGYFDYYKQSDGTARIQLSGESSANAYYILHFDSPTTGTLTYHHEDCVDDQLEVLGHMEGIPFKVTHRDYTKTAAPTRGEDPETFLQRSFKAVE